MTSAVLRFDETAKSIDKIQKREQKTIYFVRA